MRNEFTPSLLVLLGSLFFACNPDCENISNLRVNPPFNPPGYEVLITSDNPAQLMNKSVFFGEEKVEPDYREGHGLLVTVPEGFNGETEIRIEDGDCVAYASVGFMIPDEQSLYNNFGFIAPISPQFIIPNLPPVFPQSIDKLWLNPENVDYCLWFIMEKDTIIDSTMVADNVYVYDTTLVQSNTIDRNESFEQSTCSDRTDPGLLYAENPIFGIIDKEANIIDIWIDRRGIGEAQPEKFEGMFINIEDTDYKDIERFRGPLCPDRSWGKNGNMMLLTSQRTHRQVVVFQPG